MEGYFPIRIYCRLAKVRPDTAYHRYYRREVDGIMADDGRIFFYYKDPEKKPNVPVNYIPAEEFLPNSKDPGKMIRNWIRNGTVDREDVYVFKRSGVPGAKKKNIYYINKNVELNYKGPYNAANYRPSDDYLTITEWAEREGITKNTVYLGIRREKIKSVIVNNHFRFIHKEEHYDHKRSSNRSKG